MCLAQGHNAVLSVRLEPIIVLQALTVQLGHQPSFTGMEHGTPHASQVSCKGTYLWHMHKVILNMHVK